MKTVKITETPVIEQATEKTNLLVEHDGTTSRIPSQKIWERMGALVDAKLSSITNAEGVRY